MSADWLNNQVKSYTEDIDMYFAPYANLAVINYAKEIRKSHQIAFDAIGHLVPSLEIKKGTVQFKKNKFDHRKCSSHLIRYMLTV